MKSKLLAIIFGLTLTCSIGQYSNNMWYFGLNAGLDFNQIVGGYPTSVSGNPMDTEEGISCMSDAYGNLLFFTDGVSLWDYNNTLLSNSLKGSSTSTQSAIIVPKPVAIDNSRITNNNIREYYLFTVDCWGASSWTSKTGNGIYYSIINVDFNGEKTVTITQENIPLANNISFRENLIAVSNHNKDGFWVISKKYAENELTGSNAFYVYEINSTGLNTLPQIYNLGEDNLGGTIPGSANFNGTVGYLKISPNGKIIALANNYKNTVELFKFDNKTGEISPFSNTENTVLRLDLPYGIEFSPNSELLYVSCTYSKIIYQYSLIDFDNAQKEISPIITGTNYVKGAIQLGPDDKIYISKYNSNKLAVINNPNNLGDDCNLVDNAITLTSETYSQLGLPNFISSPKTDIASQDTCFYTETTFITIYDTVAYYDTIQVAVNDTLIIDFLLTGVAKPNNAKTIKVYPNPAKDVVIIDNGDYSSMTNYSVKIINSLGQEVFNNSINIPKFQITVSSLGSEGLYFIKIFDENNYLLETKKLILN